MSNIKNTGALIDDFPYANSLPKKERLWLRTFFYADEYRHHTYITMLGISEDQAAKLRQESWDRENALRRDIYWAERENLFSVNLPDFTISISRDTKQRTADAHEDIIDLSREVARRNLFHGYGNAYSLSVGSRVSLCIEGHEFQSRLGTVIGLRHDTWLIRFDDWANRFGRKYEGVCGYFRATELSNANTQALAA